MARIRTIKPEFFRHEGLFAAEKRSGLPLRLAFAGLWTAADREGRFAWAPRALKLDCLPYDDLDFVQVLDALAETGCIERYEIDGKTYGWIPSWREHQYVNHREAQSTLPAPGTHGQARADTGEHGHARAYEPEHSETTSSSHGHAWARTGGREGKGREGKYPSTTGVAEEQQEPTQEGNMYAFEQGVIRLTKRDLDRWKGAFVHLNVEAELVGLSGWADQQGQRWFHAVAGALAKRNREVGKVKTGPEFKYASGIPGVV